MNFQDWVTGHENRSGFWGSVGMNVDTLMVAAGWPAGASRAVGLLDTFIWRTGRPAATETSGGPT